MLQLLVLVITCFGRRYGINWLSAFSENFDIDRERQRQFRYFLNSRGWFKTKIAGTKHMITGYLHQTNKLPILKLAFFNSEQLQNNSGHSGMLITIKCVIIIKMTARVVSHIFLENMRLTTVYPVASGIWRC